MSLIEQIRQKHGPATLDIEVPEWDLCVTAKRLRDVDYIDLVDSVPDTGNRAKLLEYMRKVVVASLVNEDGSPLFANGDEQILIESPAITARIGAALLDFNGLSKASAKKNSATEPASSPSGSA